MTTSDLRALCERAIDIGKLSAIGLDGDYLMQLGELHESGPAIAAETLRLLDENDAMRGALEYIDKAHWFDPKEKKYACLGCDVNQGLIDEHDSWCPILRVHEVLAKLGERK